MADVVVAVTATLYPAEEVRTFVREALRVLRCPSGRVLIVDIAPGWYGGELHALITC